MKKYFKARRLSKRPGFTLVELLVVIGIIAILAAVLLSAANGAIRAANRLKASNTANQIQAAVINYYTEYSVYPVPPTPAPVTGQDYFIDDGSVTSAATSAATWKELLYILSGNVNPDGTTTTPPGITTSPNTRAISYLSLKSTDVDTAAKPAAPGSGGGGPINPLPAVATAPFFNIVIDNDYDNIVGDTGTGAGKVPNFSASKFGVATTYYTATSTGPSGGVAVWANCNKDTTAAHNNPNYYVKTY